MVAIPSKRGCLSDQDTWDLPRGLSQYVAIPSKRGCLSDIPSDLIYIETIVESQSPRSGAVFPTRKRFLRKNLRSPFRRNPLEAGLSFRREKYHERKVEFKKNVAIPSKRGCLSDCIDLPFGDFFDATRSQSPRSGAVFPTRRSMRVDDIKEKLESQSPRSGAVFPTVEVDGEKEDAIASCRNPLEAGLSFRRFGDLHRVYRRKPPGVAIPSKRGCLSDSCMGKLPEVIELWLVAIPSKRGCLSDPRDCTSAANTPGL